MIERPIAYGGDPLGDYNACKAWAIIERMIAYGRDTLGDYNDKNFSLIKSSCFFVEIFPYKNNLQFEG